jgi:hypothetical protein
MVDEKIVAKLHEIRKLQNQVRVRLSLLESPQEYNLVDEAQEKDLVILDLIALTNAQETALQDMHGRLKDTSGLLSDIVHTLWCYLSDDKTKLDEARGLLKDSSLPTVKWSLESVAWAAADSQYVEEDND